MNKYTNPFGKNKKDEEKVMKEVQKLDQLRQLFYGVGQWNETPVEVPDESA